MEINPQSSLSPSVQLDNSKLNLSWTFDQRQSMECKNDNVQHIATVLNNVEHNLTVGLCTSNLKQTPGSTVREGKMWQRVKLAF